MYDLRGNLSIVYDFYLVARELSFSKAAETNHLSQSNLTRSVKLLEEELGLKLFNRDNKGTELTKLVEQFASR
ncbi:MAG: LysR family transcriptional regulator [Bacilli bacterium]|nr:LysR family transcriptional regulator [Bacilli bacterium]